MAGLRFHNGVDDMEIADYFRSVRQMTQDQVDEIARKHDALDALPEDVYEAHQAHAEYAPASH